MAGRRPPLHPPHDRHTAAPWPPCAGRSASASVSAVTPWPCSTAHGAPTSHRPNNERSWPGGRRSRRSFIAHTHGRRDRVLGGGGVAPPVWHASCAVRPGKYSPHGAHLYHGVKAMASAAHGGGLDSRGALSPLPPATTPGGTPAKAHEPPSICLFRPPSWGPGPCRIAPGGVGRRAQSRRIGCPAPVYGGLSVWLLCRCRRLCGRWWASPPAPSRPPPPLGVGGGGGSRKLSRDNRRA